MKQFAFLSGIPRSGSQVLSSVLNQHPLIHSSTTSPIADLLISINESWPAMSSALVNRNPQQYPNMVKGLVNGAYEHIEKPFIIDKNRLWPRVANEMRMALGQKPKIIFTVRNIPDVLTSYILLIRRNSDRISFVDEELISNKMIVNDKNRCKILWEKFVQHPYSSVRMGLSSVDCDKLFLDYNEIVNYTQHTLNKICNFLSIDQFTVDLNNLQQMDENDGHHGGLDGLHEVRPVMQKTSPRPEEVIGQELTNYYTNINAEFWKKYMEQQNTL